MVFLWEGGSGRISKRQPLACGSAKVAALEGIILNMQKGLAPELLIDLYYSHKKARPRFRERAL